MTFVHESSNINCDEIIEFDYSLFSIVCCVKGVQRWNSENFFEAGEKA